MKIIDKQVDLAKVCIFKVRHFNMIIIQQQSTYPM